MLQHEADHFATPVVPSHRFRQRMAPRLPSFPSSQLFDATPRDQKPRQHIAAARIDQSRLRRSAQVTSVLRHTALNTTPTAEMTEMKGRRAQTLLCGFYILLHSLVLESPPLVSSHIGRGAPMHGDAGGRQRSLGTGTSAV